MKGVKREPVCGSEVLVSWTIAQRQMHGPMIHGGPSHTRLHLSSASLALILPKGLVLALEQGGQG